MPKFAANISMMFNEWSFMDRFNAAADAGFDAVEYLFPYDFDPDHIQQALNRNKLTQAAFNFSPGLWNLGERGIAALPDRREEFRRSVGQALVYATATGVRRIHLMAGIADPVDMDARKIYLENVCFAAETMAPYGIDVLLEPINGRDMPGYFLNDFGAAVRYIAEMGLPNVRLQFDVYHRQILHGDVTRGLEALMPLIGHVQIASVPERQEPTTGELDDHRIFQTLDLLGYSGYVGCEYRPRNGTNDGLSWMAPPV